MRRKMVAAMVAMLVVVMLGWAGAAQAAPTLSMSPPQLIDHQAPFGSPAGTGSQEQGAVSCPTASFCVTGMGRDLMTSINPSGGASAWTMALDVPEAGITGASCPTASFCVVVDSSGDVMTSTNPASGPSAWTTTPMANGGLRSVSCPSVSLCVAVGFDRIYTSTDPTDAGAWQEATVMKGFTDVSCPSSSFCAATTQDGDVFTTTAPSSGGASWSSTEVTTRRLDSLSCPSASLCVATAGFSGAIFSATNPTGGPSVWQEVETPQGGGLVSVDCPSGGLCVATSETTDELLVSTEPAGDEASAWSATGLSGFHGEASFNRFQAVDCASDSFCLASDEVGHAFTSSNPTDGTAAWSSARIDGGNGLTAVDCVSEALCAAVDASGNVLTSTNHAASWTVTDIDSANIELGFGGLTDISCPAASLCVATDDRGHVLSSTNPTGGAGAWSTAQVGSTGPIACPSASLCVAGGGSNLYVSTNPSGGAGTWVKVPGVEAVQLDCPSTSLCVGSNGAGELVSSTNPTGGAGSWQTTHLANRPEQIACPSAGLCVAMTGFGSGMSQVLGSTNPAGGAAAWATAEWPLKFTPFQGALACAAPTLCVALASGHLLASAAPLAGPTSWGEANQPVPSVYQLNPAGMSCPTPAWCVLVGAGYVRTIAITGGETGTEPPAEETSGDGGSPAPGGGGGDSGAGASPTPSTSSPLASPSPTIAGPTKPKPKPKARALKCRKGFKKQMKRGKARCVKVKKKRQGR